MEHRWGYGGLLVWEGTEFFQHVLVNTWVGEIQLEEVKQSFCNSHNGGVLQLIVQSMIPSSLCGSVRVCVVRAVRAVRAIRADPCGSVRSVRSVRYVRVRAGPCGPCRSVRTRTDLCDVWSVVCCHTMKDGENKM